MFDVSSYFPFSQGGNERYSGPTKEVEKYFAEQLSVRFPEKANPADIFLDSITLDAAAVTW